MKVVNKKIKVISKLYISERDITDVAVPAIDNPWAVDSVADPNGKRFQVTCIGMAHRGARLITEVTNLIVKGKYTDDQVVSITFRD